VERVGEGRRDGDDEEEEEVGGDASSGRQRK
jgi:hypothetical protein